MTLDHWIAVGAGLLAAMLTGIVRRVALSYGVIDLPNERSSHVTPTPRGGGAAIVASTSIGLVTLLALGRLDLPLFAALLGGGSLVAIVGLVDDRRPLPARWRLLVHFLAAAWALAWLGGLPALRFGDTLVDFGWFGYPLGALGIVWVLNLFNFMDGIDGIAGSEATFIALAAALLLAAAGAGGQGAALVFAAACAGFLAWNWPPARIFMGDVGSGYLGFFIAVFAIAAARENPVGLLVVLILGAVFFADATVTFVRRLLRGEPIHVAHRSHAYQWLSRRWGSHRRVVVVMLVINLLWLLPLAGAALRFPGWAGWIALCAVGPLLAGVLVGGAGRGQ